MSTTISPISRPTCSRLIVSSAPRLMRSISFWCSSTFISVSRSLRSGSAGRGRGSTTASAGAAAGAAGSAAAGRRVDQIMPPPPPASPRSSAATIALRSFSTRLLALDRRQRLAAIDCRADRRIVVGDGEIDPPAEQRLRLAEIDRAEHRVRHAVDDDAQAVGKAVDGDDLALPPCLVDAGNGQAGDHQGGVGDLDDAHRPRRPCRRQVDQDDVVRLGGERQQLVDHLRRDGVERQDVGRAGDDAEPRGVDLGDVAEEVGIEPVAGVEQVVQPQLRAEFEVERGVAELEVEVDQADARRCRPQDAGLDRDRGRAAAADGAEKGDDLAAWGGAAAAVRGAAWIGVTAPSSSSAVNCSGRTSAAPVRSARRVAATVRSRTAATTGRRPACSRTKRREVGEARGVERVDLDDGDVGLAQRRRGGRNAADAAAVDGQPVVAPAGGSGRRGGRRRFDDQQDAQPVAARFRIRPQGAGPLRSFRSALDQRDRHRRRVAGAALAADVGAGRWS